MYILYNFLLCFGFVFYLPFLLPKLLRGQGPEIGEKFGFLPQSLRTKTNGQTVIWIHGVSVGETVAAGPICRAIRDQFPQAKIVFSTVTDTGQKMAQKLIDADAFFYFPFDLSLVVKKVLNELNPKLVIIMETELWPNFIRVAQQRGTKVVLANGRISAKSYRGYKLFGPLLQQMLRGIDLFLMQSQPDAEYIQSLGADKERVFNCGNTKYDLNIDLAGEHCNNRLAKEMQVETNAPLLVVGSTHANEEELLIPIYKRLKAEYQDLVMILAPRHPERVKEVETLYQKAGIPTIRRTELQNARREASVIFLDTIGELLPTYSLADLVFVGGSLVKFGGHNILEPAAYGRTIFVGPYMDDFKDILSLFLNNDACIQVKDHNELEEKMLYYLKNKHEADEKGRSALRIVHLNQGATKRMVSLITGLWKE